MSVEKEKKTGVTFHFETRLRNNGLRLRPQPPFTAKGATVYGTFADYTPDMRPQPIVAYMHDYDVRLPREEREQMVANTIALCEILYQQKLLEEQE